MPVPVPAEYVDIVDAYRFLDAVTANADLKAAWQKLLEDLGSQSIDAKKKIALINNFLAQRKYRTTADVVLDFVKSDWWQSYRKSLTATPTSDRLVQDLLTRPALLAEYNRMMQSALGADADPAAASTFDGKINAWMAKKGYDCTTEQVKASWDKMRDQNVNFWTGRYGDTVQQKQDADGKPVGTAEPGPVMTLQGDGSVVFDGDVIAGSRYAAGQLSWDILATGQDFPNSCAAQLTFSHIDSLIDADDYVGNEFSGRIVRRADSVQEVYSYSGRIGERKSVPDAPAAAPEGFWEIFNKALSIGFGASLICGAALFIYKRLAARRAAGTAKPTDGQAVATTVATMKDGLDRRGKSDLPLLLDDEAYAAPARANEAGFAPSRNSTVDMVDATIATLKEAEAMGNRSVDPAVFERIETARREAIERVEKSETNRREHDFGDEHTDGAFHDLVHGE
ncbi:MAG: hypothetical protein JNM75_03425 [Rhodospirillales bacterium]|nr:hypothetical protein [Rhodospirillales bacterium]